MLEPIKLCKECSHIKFPQTYKKEDDQKCVYPWQLGFSSRRWLCRATVKKIEKSSLPYALMGIPHGA